MTDHRPPNASNKTEMLVDMVRVLYDRVNMLENRLITAEYRLTSVERWVLHEPFVIAPSTVNSSKVNEMLDTVRSMSQGEMNSFANFADIILREQ